MPDGRPKKLQRASRACDFCHKRSIRCKSSEADARKCQNCIDFDIPCTYTRPWRRARGSTAGVKDDAQQSSSGPQQSTSNTQGTPTDSQPSPAHAIDLRARPEPPVAHPAQGKAGNWHLTSYATRDALGEAWKAFAVASGPVIQSLMDMYHQIVYPIFPLFHRETLLKKLKDRDYLFDRGFFASVMAACSLVAARARDGALSPWIERGAQLDAIPAETFYAAARDTIEKDMPAATGLHYLRACALLAIASIQFGKIDGMHEYLGHYFTLSALRRFPDEVHWPKEISIIEREERRRLFWSTYTLDVYSSIVWNGQIHSREAHVHVAYPTEATDERLESAPVGFTDPSCWLHGWNFTTDLYRVLEHTVNRLRSRRNATVALRPVQTLFTPDAFSGQGVLQSVIDMYSQLPDHFKDTPSVTGDREKDIFGFQAANIQATMQLLRMVLFSVEENADVEQKCHVAAELLRVFHSVPVAYLKAISAPLIHHLAGIGTILGSVMESPLSEASYQHVRSMLLSMADLLENLESGLRTQGTSRGLRSQVDRIDEYMRMQRNAIMQPPFQNTIADLTATVPTPRAPFLATNGIDTLPAPSQFQLPPELLEDWPWPGDFKEQDYGIFPFGFD